MFSKILIANRGEIAVRIIQTCHEMEISAVAVYSEADIDALHVRRADEAYLIGPAAPLQSYLDMGAILDAAHKSGAEAIHPGYGFLAENAEFAQAVTDAGLSWIGPSADVIALMGNKVAAKELAQVAGVPVVPDYRGDDQSPRQMLSEAERIGYPVMIKAVAGGGGKGMRSIADPDAMPTALEGAQREAGAAFGDDRVFLEKLLPHPRHIEMQILADTRGNAIHLGERDCSVQRRHQKVVEEVPSPIMTERLREAMGDDAIRLVRESGYVSAGTIEFLFEADRYYFLEMNTRIQVEHPVTEMVTGLDLIRLQIEIAAGMPLRMSQLDVHLRGHSVEARLYAEDPGAGFLPATGALTVFQPPEGPGIRNDVGVLQGDTVSAYYDPMLAKLVVHAQDRAAAVRRLQDALERYVVLGVTTNLGFLHWIATHDEFKAGRIDTSFVERCWDPASQREIPDVVLLAATGFDVTGGAMRSSGLSRATEAYNPWLSGGGWRVAGMERSFTYTAGGQERRITAVRRDVDSWTMVIDGTTRSVRVERTADETVVLQEGPRVEKAVIAEIDGALVVAWKGQVYRLDRPGELDVRGSGRAVSGQLGVTAPMPGTVVKVAVQEGQRVGQHEPLVVLEAMKMEHVIEAPHDGVVREILFGVGDMVPAGAPVVRLDAS